MTASLNDAVTKIADRTGAVATAVKPIPPRSRPLAVRRQPFGASEAPSRDGRSGRCSRPGASPDNPGDRARPPRTRRPAGPRSPLCHPTAPRHPHRRSYPRRRASAPRRHNRCPTGRRAHDHCPGGSASSDRGSGRRIPGCSGSSSLSGRRQSRSPRHACRDYDTWRSEYRRPCNPRVEMMPGRLRIRSCMPQKHPPARTAR